MWWLIPVIGLVLGVYFGQFLQIEIPAGMVKYLSIGIMAALDSVFGGIKAMYEYKFDSLLMLSGFFANALLAAALAFIGDMLGVDLYYAAVFAFGVRLFSNLSLIRVYIINNLRTRSQLFRAHREALDREEYEENEEYEEYEENGEFGDNEEYEESKEYPEYEEGGIANDPGADAQAPSATEQH